MTYSIFDDMAQCTEQEVARLLNVVSDQRCQQALAYKHLHGQYCCLKSYELLLHLLHSISYPLCHKPTFLYNEYGQPRIEGGIFFSISHCKNAIMVAISHSPVGVDVEHLRIAKPEVVASTMNEAEQEHIWQSDDPDWAFTQLWTQKEAVLKMQGTGITSIDGIKNTLVALENIDLQTKVNFDRQYAYSIASSLVVPQSL